MGGVAIDMQGQQMILGTFLYYPDFSQYTGMMPNELSGCPLGILMHSFNRYTTPENCLYIPIEIACNIGILRGIL